MSATARQLKQQALKQPDQPGAWQDLARACAAQGLHAEALEAYEQLGRLQPDNWQICFAQGNQHYALGHYPEALDLYMQALGLNQGSWEVRNNLAVLLKQLGQRQLAEKCLLEALELKPDYFDAIVNLGNLYRDLRQFDKARLCFDTALELKPGSADVLTNLGLLLKEQGSLDEAIEVYRAAVALPSAPAELPFNYAIALIQSGHFHQGFEWYEQRWRMPWLIQRRQPYDAAMPEWHGEPLDGKTLLVWNEQGLGDMIQMVRFLPLLKSRHPGARIVLRVDAALQRLFTGFPGVDRVACCDAALPRADFHFSAMSFPYLFKITIDSIPDTEGYLRADAALAREWEQRLGPRSGKPRVGLVWQSGQAGVGQVALDRASRSLSADALGHLVQGQDVEWINLQVGGDPVPDAVAQRMRPLSGSIRDFADSAAILSGLDALVSVDTAAAHLGAAMGVPTLVMMRAYGGNLFPAHGDAMPWYRSMRLLRQKSLFDWASVLVEVREALRGFSQREKVLRY